MRFFIFPLLLFCSSLIIAQSPVKIQGQVLESNSRQPLEFATVMVGNADTRQPISGTTTDESGRFSLEAEGDNLYVEVSFIGFISQQIDELSIQDGRVDLGAILLVEDNRTLDEVVVRAEKSQTEFKLDKRVFNVGKDLSSTGAGALEVLNNVPSVTVNIEGEISLRGSSGVQILINGKPSVLASDQNNALGTITADMIDKIEVITNPSAKYEAEGTSGIINIVLRKEEKRGLNGSVTINTGTPHNHSLGLSMNRRTEKFNLFSQIGIGHRSLPRVDENINRDLVTNTTIISDGENFRNETFYNFILGTDYHITPRDVITLSGHFAYEIESQPSDTDFEILDANEQITSAWSRSETTEATNPKWQYELNYKKDFKDHKEHQLLFSALGNFFGKDLSSEFENTVTIGNVERNNQQTRSDFKEARYTFKLDYTKPFSKNITLEAGAQYVFQDVSNDFAVNDYVDGDWVKNVNFTNVFEYDQEVFGVYSTGAYEDDRFGLKLGLRLENTELNTLLVNTNEANEQSFYNFFPSAHASYKFSDAVSLQAGYSRRVRRPRLWDLNPFFNIRNNFSIRAGNPNLLPEFTDSYEITSIFILGKASLNFGVYHLYTTDVIERVSIFENNVNVTTPLNIGTNRATGIELNGKYSPLKWLSLNGDFNYNYFQRNGTFQDANFDFNADQWTSRLTAKFKLPAQIDFEVTGNYRSRFETVQGRISRNVFADLGLRKKIIKGKIILNLSIRDIFASRIRENEISQTDFYLYNRNFRGRFITFGLSYGFGKGDAMEFSGQKRF